MNHPWLRVLLVVLSFHGTSVWAATQTSSTAASAAMAGSGRASVEAGVVHDLNPAMLVHLRGRDFHSTMSGKTWIVGISDNTPGILVPAALSFARTTTGENALETNISDLRLSLAGYIVPQLSLGLTGKQIGLRRGEASWTRINGDVGLTWVPAEKLGIAAVFYDVLGSNRDGGQDQSQIPEDLRAEKRTGLGMNYLFRDFARVRVDFVSGSENDFGTAATLLGYEAGLNRFFLIRMGYGFEPEYDRQVISAGFGFDLPRFRLNYGYQAAAKGEFESRHTVDLGIPF